MRLSTVLTGLMALLLAFPVGADPQDRAEVLDELARLLEPLAERNLVIVISACYSGGFIDALKDERTLVMTAARADRTSFGCSDDSDFTYFGRALFAEALLQTYPNLKAVAATLRAVKSALDPQGVMNPGVLLPPA